MLIALKQDAEFRIGACISKVIIKQYRYDIVNLKKKGHCKITDDNLSNSSSESFFNRN